MWIISTIQIYYDFLCMTNINYYTYLHTQTWIVEFKRHVYQLQKPASVLLRMREHIESYEKYAMI